MPDLTLTRHVLTSLSASTALGRLALGFAAGALAGGYGRSAYAGTCAPIGTLGSYLCSGPADATTDVTQSFGPVAGDIVITSQPEFGLDTTISGGRGIEARRDQAAGSGDIEITASDITAADEAIHVDSPVDSLGLFLAEIKIDTTAGRIASETSTGVSAIGENDDIAIITADVTAARGIVSKDREAGYSRIDTTAGTVTGTAGSGLAASAYDITIATADVTGSSDGIKVSRSNSSYATARIDTTAGSVIGVNGTGISALFQEELDEPYLGGADITITTADVFGGDTGIRTDSGTYRDTSIDTSAGSVTGAGGAGIEARSFGDYNDGEGLRAVTADVSGRTDGIAITSVDGVVIVDTTAGSVTGETGNGINVDGYRAGSTITTADVSGHVHGIEASGQLRDIRIDTTAGSVTGATGDGIALTTLGYATVAASDVSGGRAGISLNGAPCCKYGSTFAEIEVSGRVSGRVGIDTAGLIRASDQVNMGTSGRIEGTDGIAMDLGDGQQFVTIFDELTGLRSQEQQGIIGRSLFGGDDDTLSFSDTVGSTNVLYDGTFSDIFDGGTGIDTANFSVGFDDLEFQSGTGSFIRLFFRGDGDERATLSLRDFELFTFANDPDVTFTSDELRNLVTPVPLPVGIVLLGSAVGFLGFAHRKTREVPAQVG